ncbi:hypothetical protein P2H44_14380 [Albimonas sp. CAU 1670]|uniref:hypothetical protein n=1 Tax=Albimonas sp. CAU 1670 TaxID=3032599 RepID=UPI0023DB8E69|nr:hypothetical protein [Albimonas sp. CAU 1670]MDF2233744.1 hypothetical protein [Albimonas sp. CAU 1670]
MSAELAAFASSGVTVLLGVGDIAGRPIAAVAGACVPDPEAGELRLYVDAAGPGAARLLAAVRAGGTVGASFTDLSHRSIQAKGARARLEPPTARDHAEYRRQVRGHAEWLATAGFSPGFCHAFSDVEESDAVMIVFAPEQVFHQTPGPGAGEAIPVSSAPRRPEAPR